MNTLLALEPRILFDGAALATGAEVAQDQTAQNQALPQPDTQPAAQTHSEPLTDTDVYPTWATISAPPDRKEIVFIDTRIDDYQTLLTGVAPGVEAVLLDPTHDGIEQIAEILSGRTDIDAIHLIAEGNDAELHLGTTFLTQESINGRYASLFAQIGQSLSMDADVLIYGCNFGRGEAGAAAMQSLAELIGADIAASTNRTGHITEYADWTLEVSTGFIETAMVIGEATQAAWESVLATFTVTNTNDSGAGSLRQAIIDANATPGTDTIVIPTGTYVLTTGKLDINDNVIITGAGAATTIIDGNANERVFETKGSSTTTMTGVTIQNGRASGNGAGVFVDNSSILNLSDAILANNNGTGGDGGAIHVHGTLNLNRVLIENNQANKGAGIYFHNAIGGSLTNVTISGNTATNEGGGIWTENPITIMNSTIAFNTAPAGGGVYDKDGMETNLTNSILHNPGSPNSFGTLISGGNNIDSDGTAGLGDPLDGQDPMLGALADNGGLTRTHALLAGSPALNAGTTTGAPAVDQRGFTRDAAPDIGAYEYKPSSFVSKNEFKVNDPSENNEITSGPARGAERAVDIAPNGDYVVVWTDTSSNTVYGKVLDASGNIKIAQFQINIGGGNNEWADVAVDDSGNFAVTWTQANDIFMRRFLANGTAVDAGDVRVNTGITNVQQNSSVNMNGAGDFVIAWEGNATEGIFVRRGSFSGGLIGSDIVVDTAAAAQDPSVGIDDSGNFVVVWDNGSDVFFQLYNSGGTLQNSGQVDVLLQLSAGGAAVDMSGDGRFTVAYRATVLDLEVYVRQFDAAGNPLYLPKIANTSGLLSTQTNPSITMDDIGEFIVVWEGVGNQSGQSDGAGVFGQKFNASGQKIGFEFLINQTTANTQDRASVAMLDRNNFVAVWTGSDGAQTDIFARQYGATTSPTLDLDANNSGGATGNDYALTFTEGDGPKAIADSDTNLADVDSTTFTYVTLTISGLLDGNAEVLILDGDTFALATDAPGQDTSGGNYHVRVSTGAGTAIVSIIKQGGGTFSEVEAETLIKAIQYQHTDTSNPTDGDRLIEVRVNDGTTDSAAARTSINVDPTNDPPTFADLDNAPIFTEDGAAVVLDGNATIVDPELDFANDYSGATLSLARNGGANTDDVFANTGTLNVLTESGSLVVGGTTTIGTVTTNSGGTLVFTFNANATTALVNSALQQITYANSSNMPPASVQIDYTINDGNASGQGSGGALSDTGSLTVTINAVNDPPTLDLDVNDSSGATGNDYAVTFTEGAGPIGIADSDTDLTDPDGTTFAYVKLAVSGLLDGNAETLIVDGDTFNLGTAVAGQNTSGGNYHVIMTTGAGTSTMTITKQGGGTFTEIETETLIKAIQYQHTDTSNPTDGDRLIDVIVNDGTDDSTAARTTINVNPVNDPPTAVADAFTVNEGSTTTLNLAGNDTDPDDGLDLTSITIVSGPANGTITSINADGTVNYTHDGSETLSDSFTYTIQDLTGVTSNTVTVSLTVTPQNDAPIATADTFTVNEGSTNTLNLANNDTDADDGLDPTSIAIVSGPAHGTITSNNNDGTVDYTHDGSETIADSFSYTIRDLAGATSNIVTVNLTVTPVNDAPIITSNGGGTTANITVSTGSTAVTDVDASDVDSNTLTYSIIGGSDAALFTIDPATGILSFITAPDINAPGDAGADNVYDVIVQVSDGTAADTQAIAVMVTQPNVPPSILNPPPPAPSPTTDPPPSDTGPGTETPVEETPGGIIPFGDSPAPVTGIGPVSTGDVPRYSDVMPNRDLNERDGQDLQPQRESRSSVNVLSEALERLQERFDPTAFPNEIRSLLTRSEFLQDLDRVRNAFNGVMATEKIYTASSVAAASGLSIGYVIWLLRSGVLLTALLSSVPAWQFVNPLLVLTNPAQKQKKGQQGTEDDSLESMFENPTESADMSKTKTGLMLRAQRFLRPWRY